MRHLQSFKYIKAIADAGSIRGAAESLTISPSALNRHIQTLEEELDIQLFERLSRGVRLSAEGELFYSFALNQMAGFARVQSQIANIKGLNVGQLRIGVGEDIHLGAFHDLIAKFQRDNVNVDVSISAITQDQVFAALEQRAIDLALFVNPVLRKGVQILHGRDIQFAGFLPVGTGITGADQLHVYDLAGCRLALPPKDSEVTKRFSSAAEKFEIELYQHYSGPDVFSYLSRTYAPVIGVTAILEATENETQLGGYRRVPLSAREMGNCTICLLSGDSHGMSNAAHRFQEVFSEMFQ